MFSQLQRTGVWDEELMCDVEPPQRAPSPRSRAGLVRAEVSARNLALAAGHTHEVIRGGTPSVIYAQEGTRHGNFLEASFARIAARPEWAKRLKKAHSAKRQARPTGEREEVRPWFELDAATSSDALLMNIFCYPRVLSSRFCKLLGVEPGSTPEFGYKPHVPLRRGLFDQSEIDMRLGTLLVEAKLTETGFQTAPMRLLERYPAFDELFERDSLFPDARGVEGYQLIRGIMAAAHTQSTYCVMLDARRPELLEQWFTAVRAVRSYELQSKLRVLTWQEVARQTPKPLQRFLQEKYGIVAAT